jgi:hypothetical protein
VENKLSLRMDGWMIYFYKTIRKCVDVGLGMAYEFVFTIGMTHDKMYITTQLLKITYIIGY